MATFTYKVSYLNDPYQQFLSAQNSKNNKKDISTSSSTLEVNNYLGVPSKNSNGSSSIISNNKLSPSLNKKKDNRMTELFLNVNDIGVYKDLEKQGEDLLDLTKESKMSENSRHINETNMNKGSFINNEKTMMLSSSKNNQNKSNSGNMVSKNRKKELRISSSMVFNHKSQDYYSASSKSAGANANTSFHIPTPPPSTPSTPSPPPSSSNTTKENSNQKGQGLKEYIELHKTTNKLLSINTSLIASATVTKKPKAMYIPTTNTPVTPLSSTINNLNSPISSSSSSSSTQKNSLFKSRSIKSSKSANSPISKFMTKSNNKKDKSEVLPLSAKSYNAILDTKKKSSNQQFLSPTSASTVKSKDNFKRSSFLNPLMNMSFEVGSLLDEDLFSKIDTISEEDDEEESGNVSNILKGINSDEEDSNDDVDDLKRQSVCTIKGLSTSTSNEENISRNSTIKSNHQDINKHSSQDTIIMANQHHTNLVEKKGSNEKNLMEEVNVSEFNNDVMKNLNSNPKITMEDNYLNGNNNDTYQMTPSTNGFDNSFFYRDDDKVQQIEEQDEEEIPVWKMGHKSGKDKKNNYANSIKSSQSKMSSFSTFTYQSTKMVGKFTKNIYKKMVKHKHKTSKSSFDPFEEDKGHNFNNNIVPQNNNLKVLSSKELEFEKMISGNETISLTLSTPNALTSNFADQNFPLEEQYEDENTEEDFQNDNDKDTLQPNYDNSFYSQYSSYEEENDDINNQDTLTKRKHKNRNRHIGINFEEALPEGDLFRSSLANL